MTKCATVGCSSTAKLRVFWPGQRRDFCADCAKRAVHVAQAMGFGLSFSAIPREEYEPPAIESTRELSPVAAAIAAAQLTPEQIAERRAIGERRAPKRDAALKRFIQRTAAEQARASANLCASCGHSESEHGHRECDHELEHDGSGKWCQCEGFEQSHAEGCPRDNSCTCDGRSSLPLLHG